MGGEGRGFAEWNAAEQSVRRQTLGAPIRPQVLLFPNATHGLLLCSSLSITFIYLSLSRRLPHSLPHQLEIIGCCFNGSVADQLGCDYLEEELLKQEILALTF